MTNNSEIIQLIGEVESLQKANSSNIVYIDALEVLKLSKLLLEKFEKPKSDYSISFSVEDWRDNAIPLGRLKVFLKKLESGGVIEHLHFMAGGNGFFKVLDKLQFAGAIDEAINGVKNNIGILGPEAKENVLNKLNIATIEDLKDFKSFVEKDAFSTFWENKKIGETLRNQAEDIGKALLMAFFRGQSMGFVAQEIPVGRGFQDVLIVKDPKAPIIIETKVLTGRNKKYDEGKFQLKDYVNKNNQREGYYVIFQTDNFYATESFEYENICINQISINISPGAPTKIFRKK